MLRPTDAHQALLQCPQCGWYKAIDCFVIDEKLCDICHGDNMQTKALQEEYDDTQG